MKPDYTPSTEAWVKLPLELLRRQGISKRAAILISIIIRRCKYKRDLSAPITTDELITDSGMSRRTTFRALDELRALDLIRVQRTGRASVYTLTPGCVELCPRAVQDDHPAEQRQRASSACTRSKRRPKPTQDELDKMDKYLCLVNRFKEDEDEPLPGQQSFFDKGGEAV